MNQLANSLMRFTPYPSLKDVRNLCISLIMKYAQLHDGSHGGFDSWTIYVKFKIGNLRKDMPDLAEIQRYKINRKSRRNPDGDLAHYKIKKPRRGVVQHLQV